MSRIWCRTVSTSTLERIISVASCSTAISRTLGWTSKSGLGWGSDAHIIAIFRGPPSGKSRADKYSPPQQALLQSATLPRSEGRKHVRQRLHDQQRDDAERLRTPHRRRPPDPSYRKTPRSHSEQRRLGRGHH